MFRLREVLEPCRRPPLPCPYLLPRLLSFLSRDSFSRLCFRMPTRSSSTLCWIPDEVSMNFESRDAASDLPSANSVSVIRSGEQSLSRGAYLKWGSLSPWPGPLCFRRGSRTCRACSSPARGSSECPPRLGKCRG